MISKYLERKLVMSVAEVALMFVGVLFSGNERDD
jgi:hypothetical protein